MNHQNVDQAAYRKGFSTEDHLLTVSLLVQNSREYNYPLRLALVDFEKAFDSVDHGALWEVLEKQTVPKHYIERLKRLYVGQATCVQAGVRSRVFSIGHGVEHGDPTNALLFIGVMQGLLGSQHSKWDAAKQRRKRA